MGYLLHATFYMHASNLAWGVYNNSLMTWDYTLRLAHTTWL